MKSFRARRGLPQNEVARAMEVSTESRRRYPDNECKPSKRDLPKLRYVFGLDGEINRYFK